MSSVNDMVLVQGMAHTRTALREWNDHPGRVLWPWVALSFLVACGLLFAVYLVAKAATPQPAILHFAGLTHPPDLEDYLHILYRNGLVLALHAMACVAGFIAGSSLPLSAANRSGVDRWVHERPGRWRSGSFSAQRSSHSAPRPTASAFWQRTSRGCCRSARGR